ncbi:MAG: hypothetical protein F7B59_03040 [Desulfurococcales archaeon]|nr:hypothetical protein [Desulfurococcales archaeon]
MGNPAYLPGIMYLSMATPRMYGEARVARVAPIILATIIARSLRSLKASLMNLDNRLHVLLVDASSHPHHSPI